MRRCRKLVTLRLVTDRRLNRLRAIVQTLQPNQVRRFEADIAYVTIDLLNTWTNFVRAYYLSCSLGTETLAGQIATAAANFIDHNAAMGFAVLQWRPGAAPNAHGVWHRRDEPTWHDKVVLLRLSLHAGFANDVTVQASLSLPADSLNHLPVFRNFFAHRNRGTFGAAMNVSSYYSIYGREKPSLVLVANPLRRPQSLISEWIDEVETVAGALCA